MSTNIAETGMVISTSPLVRTYTLDEFWALPDPPNRYKLELIRGVLYMTPPPDEKTHDPVVSHLADILILELNRVGKPGKLFFPRSGIWTYYPDTWLEPDLFYLSKESIERFKDKPRTSADLVIEVLSPGSADYDRTTKADSYLALGVKELWLVDPQRRTIELLHNEDKRWARRQHFGEGEFVGSDVIPGLKLSVTDVFAE